MKSESTRNSLISKCSTTISNHSILWLRISVAIVYCWFGALKIIGISPKSFRHGAQGLVDIYIMHRFLDEA